MSDIESHAVVRDTVEMSPPTWRGVGVALQADLVRADHERRAGRRTANLSPDRAAIATMPARITATKVVDVRQLRKPALHAVIATLARVLAW
jgi:hypothetical protein